MQEAVRLGQPIIETLKQKQKKEEPALEFEAVLQPASLIQVGLPAKFVPFWLPHL